MRPVQIKALLPFCEITIFNSNPWYRGEYEQIDGVRFFDFHLFANRLPTLTKPLGYAWWEQQTLRVAKKITKPDIIHLHGAAMRGKWVEKLANFILHNDSNMVSKIGNRFFSMRDFYSSSRKPSISLRSLFVGLPVPFLR